MQIRHQDTFLAIYLDFMRNENWENLTTELNFKVKIQPVGCPKDVYHAKATFEKNRKTVTNGYARLINWDEVERKYTENGRLPLEIQVKVNKTIDARKADLRSFGDERSEFSDVTLNVDDELFHVSKHVSTINQTGLRRSNVEIMTFLREKFRSLASMELTLMHL